MLPKNLRLPSSEFKKIKQSPHLIQAKYFGLAYTYGPNHQKNPRFGYIVSKTISPQAVIRNNIKRRLRQIVVAHYSLAPNSLNTIFLSKKSILTADTKSLSSDFKIAIKKLTPNV
jgi:ribonuclease P protein component